MPEVADEDLRKVRALLRSVVHAAADIVEEPEDEHVAEDRSSTILADSSAALNIVNRLLGET